MDTSNWGKNIILGENITIGENVRIGHNCIIEDNVVIGDDTFIDSGTTIRSFTSIGAQSNIGSNCIIGEYLMDFYMDHEKHKHELIIGEKALTRSGSVIYAGSTIGDNFQTGHHVTIREKAEIGNDVSVGTLCDIEGSCKIGNYVRMQCNVLIGQLSVIDDFVWLFPNVILTNDPTPPSEHFVGVHVHSFATVAAGAIIMPGMDLEHDCLIGAAAVVTKPVEPYAVAVGSPARVISDVRNVRNKVTGELVYPWREHFDRYMPWGCMGFDAGYASLDLEERSKYTLADIVG